MPLSVIPHHSQNIMVSFSISGFPTCTLLLHHIHACHLICITPLHLTRSSPYRLHSNSTCSPVSTCPHPQQSSSYFHPIISLPFTGRHPPLTISITQAPTLPSAKLSFLWHLFISTYSFSLSVALNPLFHDCLPTSCILSQMYFFHSFLSILSSPFHSHSHPSTKKIN